MRTGPILALASAVCLAAFAPAALAQQRAVDHHGNWVVNFGKPAASPATPRSERSRQSRRSRSSERKAVAKRPKPALVKFVDEAGRRYNPSSNVWFDGKSACWSGEEPFTYKDGAWRYGEAAWTEVGTGWATTTATAPERVSCESDPEFAAAAKAYASGSLPQRPDAEVQKTGGSPRECKKYFAHIGQMLTVPCAD